MSNMSGEISDNLTPSIKNDKLNSELNYIQTRFYKAKIFRQNYLPSERFSLDSHSQEVSVQNEES